MKAVLKILIPAIAVLALLEPLVCGYFAERRIREYFASSPVGDLAIKEYGRSYLSSDLKLEFNARDLLCETLERSVMEKCEGLLTSVVFQTSARIYHCPSLKDPGFAMKSSGETRILMPGNLAKDIKATASLGWDGVMLVNFSMPGDKFDAEKLDDVVPGGEFLDGLALEVGTIEGRLAVPLSGGKGSFDLTAQGARMGQGGFDGLTLKGHGHRVASGVRTYALTGTVQKAQGGAFGASEGLLLVRGFESNRLHTASLVMKSLATGGSSGVPLEFNLDVRRCNIDRLKSVRRHLAGLRSSKNKRIGLGFLSEISAAMESVKAFIKDRPALDCKGLMDLQEGQGSVSLSCDASNLKLETWTDLVKVPERLSGDLKVVLPAASLEESGSLAPVLAQLGISRSLMQRFLMSQAALSNGFYVWSARTGDLLAPKPSNMRR